MGVHFILNFIHTVIICLYFKINGKYEQLFGSLKKFYLIEILEKQVLCVRVFLNDGSRSEGKYGNVYEHIYRGYAGFGHQCQVHLMMVEGGIYQNIIIFCHGIQGLFQVHEVFLKDLGGLRETLISWKKYIGTTTRYVFIA